MDTLGLDFATMTPQIWIYVRAFLSDITPILIIIGGAIIAFFVATKLIDILSGTGRSKINVAADKAEAEAAERFAGYDDDDYDDDDDEE